MDTEFQWQVCSYMLQAAFMISLWIYQFVCKFSLSEDNFQFQVHNTISKMRISGMRSLHKPCTHPAPAVLTCVSHPTETPFHRKCSWYCTNSITLLTSGNRASNTLWLIHDCLSKRRNILVSSCWLTPSGTHHTPGWMESHSPLCKPEWLFHL